MITARIQNITTFRFICANQKKMFVLVNYNSTHDIHPLASTAYQLDLA